MSIERGPLTDRQTRIIHHLRTGLRQYQIASKMGLTVGTVRREVKTITHKMGTDTLQAALLQYGTAVAYREAAETLRNHLVGGPVDGVEDHVNHVLLGIAALFDGEAEMRLPK